MIHTLYMEVTPDKYELPLAVAESLAELAKMRMMTYNALHHTFGKSKLRRFVKVDVNDTEFDEKTHKYKTCLNWGEES